MRDFEIRSLMRETELNEFFLDENSKVVDELDISTTGSRIDIAVINGHMHGYEIKSSQDTLMRLSGQLASYALVFDYISVVTEKKHFHRIISNIPDNIGIYVCHKNSIEIFRKPEFNHEKNGFNLAQLLWREELLSVLEENKIPHKKKSRNWILCEVLDHYLDVEQISTIVRNKVKQRVNWKTC